MKEKQSEEVFIVIPKGHSRIWTLYHEHGGPPVSYKDSRFPTNAKNKLEQASPFLHHEHKGRLSNTMVKKLGPS